MKKKKLLSVLVAAALSCSLFSAVPVVSQAADTSGVTMYRLYNPNSGEHFYTKNASEKSGLVTAGWKDEGIGWIAPEKSNTPVYRLYNPNSGDHHYTTSSLERQTCINAGWNDEGIGWYSDDNKTVPLYREYNPNAVTGTHNYTTDKAEHDGLVKAGWKDEGIGWYGISTGGEDVFLKSISLSETSLKLMVGDTKSLRVTYDPADYNGDRTVTWTSSDPSVASVDERGVVTAVSEGDATIIASVNGKTASCDVYVETKIVHVSYITLSDFSLEMTVGDRSTITADIHPENYNVSDTLTWTSADETVAKVDQNGQVEAVGAGRTEITASIDGVSKSCSVHVKAKTEEFTIGETWTVPNQWRFRVDSVEKHYACNSFSPKTGGEVLIINYTYWNDGYEGSIQKGLYISTLDIDVYDSMGMATESYPCTHEAYPKELIKGTSCSAGEAFYLNNAGGPITLYISKCTSTNGNTGDERSAIFKLDIGGHAKQDETKSGIETARQYIMKNGVKDGDSYKYEVNRDGHILTMSCLEDAGIMFTDSFMHDDMFVGSGIIVADDNRSISNMRYSKDGDYFDVSAGINNKTYDAAKDNLSFSYSDGNATLYSSIGSDTINGASNATLKMSFVYWNAILSTMGTNMNDVAFPNYSGF